MNKIIIALTMFVIAFQTTFADENLDSLTMEEAVKLALENNFSIKIARKEAFLEENNLSIGNAGFLPSLDLTGRLNQTSQNVQQEFIDGRIVDRDGAKSTAYEGALGLNWTVFDGFKMFINYDRLSDLKNIGKLRLKAQVENTIRDVINSYLTILRQKLALEVASDNLIISRKRNQFVQDKYDVGTASKIDLLQAGVDLNTDISDSLDQQITYDNMKVELNRLLNRDLNTDFELNGVIDIGIDYSKDELAKVDNNIDVMIAKQIIEINKYDIEALRSEFYPRISLYGNYNYNRQESEAGFLMKNTANGINYGLNLSFNLFNGMNTSRQLENAQVNVEIADYMMRELHQDVASAISKSLNGYTKFKELTRFEEENVKAANENMELAQESLNLGLMSALEFRETQRRLANAHLRLITSEYNAKINEIELLRLTGNLVKEQ